MTWGLCFGPAWNTSIAELIDPARAAEAAGFDRITTGEFRNDSLTWMAVLTAATDSVRVATTITSIALRHPTVVAEAVAALRDVHGDRIELGLGVSHPALVTGDLELEQPTLDDLEDYVAAVRSVLVGEAKAAGRFVVPSHDRRRREATDLPILVSALGEVAASRAARFADGIILTWADTTWIRRIVRSVRAEDDQSGRDTAVWVVLPTFTTPDVHAATEACVRHLRPYLRLPAYARMLGAATGDTERIERAADPHLSDRLVADVLGHDLIRGVAALGDRERVTRAIEDMYDAGADSVVLYPLDTGAGWREAVDTTIKQCGPR